MMRASPYILVILTLLPAVSRAAEIPPDVPHQVWSGCFVGASGGYAFGKSTKDNQVNVGGMIFNLNTDRNNLSGPAVGAQLGCNLQRSNWVFGPEIEGWYQHLRGSSDGLAPPPAPLTETIHASTQSDWTAAASLRLGHAFGNVLIYGKGGVAFANFKHEALISEGSTPLDALQTGRKLSVGYIVGGGIEQMLNRQWSIKAEYNHLDFGTTRPSFDLALDYSLPNPRVLPGSTASREFTNVFRVGVNYRFR